MIKLIIGNLLISKAPTKSTKQNKRERNKKICMILYNLLSPILVSFKINSFLYLITCVTAIMTVCNISIILNALSWIKGIPENSTLTFEIELLEAAGPKKEISDMEYEDKVEWGRKYKDEGNEIYKSIMFALFKWLADYRNLA